MGHIPTGNVIWSLKRYTRDGNLWDRICSGASKRLRLQFEHLAAGVERPYARKGCVQVMNEGLRNPLFLHSTMQRGERQEGNDIWESTLQAV